MKYIYILSMISFSSVCSSQQMVEIKDTSLNNRVYQAGRELIKFQRGYNTGTIMMLAGTGIAAVGVAGTGEPTPAILGGVMVLAGTIISITSHAHIGKAGRYLTGNGFSIPLNEPKKKSAPKKTKHQDE